MADSGWSRTGQDAAETTLPSEDSDVGPDVPAFLDLRIGFVSVRYLLILVGGTVGAFVGLVLGGIDYSAFDPETDFNFPTTFAGFVVGCVTCDLVLRFGRRLAKKKQG